MIERERCIDLTLYDETGSLDSNDELDESLSTSMSLDHDTTVSDLGNLIQFSNHAIKSFAIFPYFGLIIVLMILLNCLKQKTETLKTYMTRIIILLLVIQDSARILAVRQRMEMWKV